jgi:hypothetical protein
VHCQPAGSGRKVLDYLGRYVFQIALTNSRLEQIGNGQVTLSGIGKAAAKSGAA